MEIFAEIWLTKVLTKIFTSKPYSRATRETFMNLSVQSWKTWDLDHLTPSWAYIWNGSWKHPENMFFTQKQLEKLWKTRVIQITSKSKQKEPQKKNLFGLIHIWLSTHISHLNMYNHTNEIGLHWTLNLCVVCVNQVWNSS